MACWRAWVVSDGASTWGGRQRRRPCGARPCWRGCQTQTGWDGGAEREISEAGSSRPQQAARPETLSFSSPIQAGLSLGGWGGADVSAGVWLHGDEGWCGGGGGV
eukprot:COSAG01_NODE_4523_length_4954_cov_116.868795_3_plen_105_part_00